MKCFSTSYYQQKRKTLAIMEGTIRLVNFKTSEQTISIFKYLRESHKYISGLSFVIFSLEEFN